MEGVEYVEKEKFCLQLNMSGMMYYCGSVKMEVLDNLEGYLDVVIENMAENKKVDGQKKERQIPTMRKMAQILNKLLYGLSIPNSP